MVTERLMRCAVLLGPRVGAGRSDMLEASSARRPIGPPDDLDSAVVQPSKLLRQLPATVSRLRRELSAFGVVGAVCFVLDVGLFQFLYTVVGVDAVTAKLISTLVSTTAAYLGHRYWSFSARARIGVGREYVRFALINGSTLLLGLLIVFVVRHPLHQQSALVLQLANVASIAIGTVIRYLSYRRWVFPAHPVTVHAPLVDVV